MPSLLSPRQAFRRVSSSSSSPPTALALALQQIASPASALAALPALSSSSSPSASGPSPAPSPAPAEPRPHFFCISPDACTNPSYYWLGPYDEVERKFDLAAAVGPFRLDLGDICYAPNTLYDEKNVRRGARMVCNKLC